MKRKNEAGQALILTAIGLSVLMGFAGLGIDMGVMRYEKRLQQTAADAAALAGASNLSYQGVVVGGQNAAATNGFADNSGGAISACTAAGAAVDTVCIEINNPPTSGPHAGDANYVEALVADVHPTFFMQLLGIHTTAITARAVATNNLGGPGCIYALNPAANQAFDESGGQSVLHAPTCGILVDSDSASALSVSGGATLTAGSIGVAGGSSISGGSTVTPPPVKGMPAAADPLAYLQADTPAVGNCPANSKTLTINSTPSQPLQPGTYCNGISINGNGTTVTFASGTYVLNGGGLQVQGGSNVTGSNVTFYNTVSATTSYKPIVVSGGSSSSLSAETTGPLAGILFFEDPNLPANDWNKQNTISGGSSTTFTGALYFLHSPLVFSGGSVANPAHTVIVADTITISGGSVIANLSALPGGVPDPVKDALLVE